VARKLKTFLTSLGFFDQAVAAPSMKAALEAWGADSNLFHQGFAKQVDDPAIVEATMAKPGVVLKRPIGSNGSFNETAELPDKLPSGRTEARKQVRPPAKHTDRPKKADRKAAQEAAAAFDKQQEKRDRQRRAEEARLRKATERRQKAVAKIEAALEAAEQEHASKMAVIERARLAVEKRSEEEEARWTQAKNKLQSELRRVRT
jgi:colicin import membrane protein